MATPEVQNESYFAIDNEYFNDELDKVVASILPQFDRIVKSYAWIDILFSSLLLAETGLLIVFFNLLLATSTFSFGLALIFFTFFSYFMVRQYLHVRKPDQFEGFKERFCRGCKQLMKFRQGIPEHHLAMAHACCRLATAMQGRESGYFQPPSWLCGALPTIEKVSRRYFSRDLLTIREMLLENSVEEHIELIRCEPISLDAHAALANAYVILSGLYVAFSKKSQEEEILADSGHFMEEMERKFRETAEKAIEEFKILNAYAPNDPWVHTQLAYSYRDLKMPQEEIREYEIILRLRPDDQQTLFRLGRLYFEQGMNAKGLKIYEVLKQSNFKQAEELIAYYGSH